MHALHRTQHCKQYQPLPAPNNIFAPLQVVVDCCARVFIFIFLFWGVTIKFCGDLLCHCLPSLHELHRRQHFFQYKPLPAHNNIFFSVAGCDWLLYWIFFFLFLFSDALLSISVGSCCVVAYRHCLAVTALSAIQAPPSAKQHIEGCGWLLWSIFLILFLFLDELCLSFVGIFLVVERHHCMCLTGDSGVIDASPSQHPKHLCSVAGCGWLLW